MSRHRSRIERLETALADKTARIPMPMPRFIEVLPGEPEPELPPPPPGYDPDIHRPLYIFVHKSYEDEQEQNQN